MNTRMNSQFKGARVHDFPENMVGFPERNDVERPSLEMERIHVDFRTMDISRKNGEELLRELTEQPVIH